MDHHAVGTVGEQCPSPHSAGANSRLNQTFMRTLLQPAGNRAKTMALAPVAQSSLPDF